MDAHTHCCWRLATEPDLGSTVLRRLFGYRSPAEAAAEAEGRPLDDPREADPAPPGRDAPPSPAAYWDAEALARLGVPEPARHRLLGPSAEGRVETARREADRLGLRVLVRDREGYPRRLAECPDAPPILFVRGHLPPDPPRVLAVVGTRRASAYGTAAVRRTLGGLAHLGVPVVSGLAFGIDAAAHRAALDEGLPTWAVLAGGLDRVYPKPNERLARELLDAGGALVSEMPPGVPAEARRFPRRNRVVAGLADALWVVESGSRGGSMISADLAGSYHREVLALPGPVDREGSAGCHALIRTHRAALVTGAGDLLRCLDWPSPGRLWADGQGIPPRMATVLRPLALYGPQETGRLAGLLGRPTEALVALLTEAELQGWVVRRGTAWAPARARDPGA